MKYFESMPIISYNGQNVRNILTRVALTDNTKANKQIFLPYTQKEYERTDVLSYKYYDSPDWSWLVWFSNESVDPYYDYSLSDLDFQSMIISKYGSIEKAISYVHHWQTNWLSSDTTLTVSEYNDLPQNHRKYFNPVLDNALRIHSYKRKRKDLTATTNQVVSITFAEPINNPFQYGEKILGGSPSVYGFVTYADENSVTIQHVEGSFVGGMNITGTESNIQAVSNVVSVVSQTIPVDEYIYWEPVTEYLYQSQLNQDKRQIKLIDNTYKYDIEAEVRRVMNI